MTSPPAPRAPKSYAQRFREQLGTHYTEGAAKGHLTGAATFDECHHPDCRAAHVGPPAPRAPQLAPDWRQIACVQPEDGQYCLVWRAWPGRMAVHMFERRQIGWTWQGLYGWEPTHWVPLPAPPEKADD
jgi:hypothetical protein